MFGICWCSVWKSCKGGGRFIIREITGFENRKYEYILILDDIDLDRLLTINYDTQQKYLTNT